jgi:hypothetical protein
VATKPDGSHEVAKEAQKGAPNVEPADKPGAAAPKATSLAPIGKTDRAYLDELVARAERLRLAESRSWHRLLHYRSSWFGGFESEADGPGLFNAKDGKTNPEAELEATIRGLFSPFSGPPQLAHPYCRFPARLAWLNARLGFDFSRLAKRPCPKFDEFVDLLKPDSITLVFSSYYLNNPSSALGHTFLRVNKKNPTTGKRQELLDTGIDFSATVDTNNALVYAIKGLAGMFPGVYRRLPYYYKVREYNDFESRDLWEYELNLDPDQVALVVAHIWELGSTYFDYYYLSENCSYHILGALEVADPKLELVKYAGWPVAPADTIKALYENPGLVKSVNYRPSNRSQFTRRVSVLDGNELDALAALLEDANAPFPEDLGQAGQMRSLDAALDLADIRYGEEILFEPDSAAAREKQVLLERRAALGIVSPPLEIDKQAEEQPHTGHDSVRFGLGEGWDSKRGAYYNVDFRLSLHGLADPPRGYPDGVQLEFLPTELRYSLEQKRLRLEEFWGVRIQSYTAQTRFDRSISWKIAIGASTLRDPGCHCTAGTAELGGGGAFGLGDKLLVFGTVDTRIYGLAPIEGGINDWPLRASIGPAAGFRARLSDLAVLLAEGRFEYLPFQDPTFTYTARETLRIGLTTNVALNVESVQRRDAWSAHGGMMLYY